VHITFETRKVSERISS